MEKNDLLAGFGNLLKDVKAQQSSWTTHVKFDGGVANFWDGVKAIRAALMTQAIMTGTEVVEIQIGDQKSPKNWKEFKFGERLYTSKDISVEKIATGVFLSSEYQGVYVLIGSSAEVSKLAELCKQVVNG